MEAVTLRLKMALDEGDSSQEEAAIVLAKEIVSTQEAAERRRATAMTMRQSLASAKHARTPTRPTLADLQESKEEDGEAALPPLPASSPTHALRAELFHILLTYWLQRQFHRQWAHHQTLLQAAAGASAGASASSISLGSFFPPLPTLDPRISSLLPASYTFASYTDVVLRERTKFEQEMEETREERRRREKGKTPASGPTVSSAMGVVPWPTDLPLMLPSPATLVAHSPSSSSGGGGVQVDLPMSGLLDQLKQFAEKLEASRPQPKA